MHMLHEAKGILGKGLEGRTEEELLREIQRNPDGGIADINKAVTTYRKRLNKLEGNGGQSLMPVPQSCPDEQHRDSSKFVFSTGGCSDQSKFVWPQLLNPYDPEVYSVRVFSLSGGRPQITGDDVQPYPRNGHNVADKIGDSYEVSDNGRDGIAMDFMLRGDIRFMPRGGAYAVEFVRK